MWGHLVQPLPNHFGLLFVLSIRFCHFYLKVDGEYMKLSCNSGCYECLKDSFVDCIALQDNVDKLMQWTSAVKIFYALVNLVKVLEGFNHHFCYLL